MRSPCHSGSAASRGDGALAERSPGRVLTQSRYSAFPVVPRMGLGSSPHGAGRRAGRLERPPRCSGPARWRTGRRRRAQPLPPDLELGLDQDHHVAAGVVSRGDDVEDHPQRDEAEVGDDDVESGREVAGPHLADVEPGPLGDPGVPGDLRDQLVVADVECDDVRRAGRQQHLA